MSKYFSKIGKIVNIPEDIFVVTGKSFFAGGSIF